MALSTSATVIGSTGLVGSHILTHLLSYPSVASVNTLIRRPSPNPPADPHSKLHETINSDNSTWASALPSLLPSPSTTTLFSALGTTRADAGGLAEQRKIDLDLNVALATAAKAAGIKTYVLISTFGANKNSWAPYSQMKGELEEAVSALGFERLVLVKPGLIVGAREKSRWNEQPFHSLANLLGGIKAGLKDVWAQDASTIARAAVRAGLEEAVWEGRTTKDGPNGGKVWYMSQAEIVELGKQ